METKGSSQFCNGLVDLEFNGPVNTIKVMSTKSVYLHTFPGHQYLCTFF